MMLRNEIQRLAIWYIPVAILSIVASAWYSGLLKDAVLNNGIEVGAFVNTFSYIPTALSISLRIVIAAWLYYVINKSEGNKYIWFMFGIVAHLFAVVIFVGVNINDAIASNKSSNLTGAKDAPSS